MRRCSTRSRRRITPLSMDLRSTRSLAPEAKPSAPPLFSLDRTVYDRSGSVVKCGCIFARGTHIEPPFSLLHHLRHLAAPITLSPVQRGLNHRAFNHTLLLFTASPSSIAAPHWDAMFCAAGGVLVSKICAMRAQQVGWGFFPLQHFREGKDRLGPR